MNPGPVEVCRWRQPRKLPGGSKRADGTQPTPTHHLTPPMTTPAPWITDQPPTYRDADSRQHVIVSTDIDSSRDNCALMHWSRAAQGNLPWRHTSRWVDHEPEPPAPVIVTPEAEPEEAALRFRVGQVWRTRDNQTCEIIEIDSDDLPIKTNLYGGYWHKLNGKDCLSTNNQDSGSDLVELIIENPPQPEPMVTTPAPAAPEREPEKTRRGFLEFVRLPYSTGFLDSAVGTDNTAWVRYRVGNSDDDIWIKVRPLPQPGEE